MRPLVQSSELNKENKPNLPLNNILYTPDLKTHQQKEWFLLSATTIYHCLSSKHLIIIFYFVYSILLSITPRFQRIQASQSYDYSSNTLPVFPFGQITTENIYPAPRQKKSVLNTKTTSKLKVSWFKCILTTNLYTELTMYWTPF